MVEPPSWKVWSSKWESSPQFSGSLFLLFQHQGVNAKIGVKIKNMSNHHLDIFIVIIWLMVSTHPKNMIVKLDHFPGFGVKMKNVWNHHPQKWYVLPIFLIYLYFLFFVSGKSMKFPCHWETLQPKAIDQWCHCGLKTLHLPWIWILDDPKSKYFHNSSSMIWWWINDAIDIDIDYRF